MIDMLKINRINNILTNNAIINDATNKRIFAKTKTDKVVETFALILAGSTVLISPFIETTTMGGCFIGVFFVVSGTFILCLKAFELGVIAAVKFINK